MRPLIPVLLFLSVIPTGVAYAAELLPVKINGLDPELEVYVRKAIALPENKDKAVEISEGRLSYYASSLKGLVEDSLEPLGYYQSEVNSAVVRNQKQVQINLDIKLGEPVTVRSRNLKLEGQAEQDRFIGFWLESFSPQIGEMFNHGIYEDNKASISQALLDRGYFDQANTVHEVQVTRATLSADIDLVWDSGQRYRYGAVRFEGNIFQPGLLEQLVNFEQGKYYSQPQINRLQESLIKLNYFSSIHIVPDLKNKQGDEVPILVNLTQGKRSYYNTSLRYGTDTGVGVEFGLERRWLNTAGHKLDFNVAVAQNEQAITALYRIPAFHWLDGWYGIGLVARNEQYQYTANNRYIELTANRSGELRNWNLLASVNVRRERFDEAINDINQPVINNPYTSVFYPEFNAVWRKSDNPLYPTSGSAWYFQTRAGFEFEASDAIFAQGYIKNKRIISLNSSNRILLRAELGALWSQDYTFFPTSLRFYAGGDQSLRGYSYQEIGEYIDGINFGGRYLAIGSFEYEHRILPDWAIAGFVDVGDAFDTDPKANIGTGLGARWRSPIGPVRFDVAYGFDGPDPGFAIHFTIGADL